MSTPPGLLAHLATRMGLPGEPLATEALTWLLQDVRGAAGLAKYVRTVDSGLPKTLRFVHQVVAADGSRPDLVGYDEYGHGRVVVEVKFDAGLMATQPVAYLRQAAQARDEVAASPDDEQTPGRVVALVLFVVPRRRLQSLEAELLRRVREVWPEAVVAGRGCLVEEGLRLLCVSWDEVLDAIQAGLYGQDGQGSQGSQDAPGRPTDWEPPGEDVVDGLRQLQGLVARYEARTFEPMTAEDLTDQRLPLLWTNLTLLLQAAVAQVVHDPECQSDRKALTNGWSQDSWGLYLHLGGLECLVAKHAEWWREYGDGPAWLWINANVPARVAWLRRALAESPEFDAIMLRERPDGLVLPLRVLAGADQQQAVDGLARQLRALARALIATRPDLPGPELVAGSGVVAEVVP